MRKKADAPYFDHFRAKEIKWMKRLLAIANLIIATLLSAPSGGAGYKVYGQSPGGDLCAEVIESVKGAYKQKNAFVYGLILNSNPGAVDSEYAHKLVINDLKAAAPDGLPGGPGGMRRPAAVVVCNKGRDESGSLTRSAADYLIKNAKVSAIVTLTTAQTVAAQEAIAASGQSVLLICEQCSAGVRDAVAGIGDPSLVFQNNPAVGVYSPLIHKTLPEFETLVRGFARFDGSAKIRVALIDSDYQAYSGLAASADRTLVINGAKASSQRGTNYIRVTYKSSPTGGGFDADAVASAVASFKPHIVLGIGSSELGSVFNAIEQRLGPTAPKPLYGGWTRTGALQTFIGGDEDRRVRTYFAVAGSLPPTQEQRERRTAAMANFAHEFPGVRVSDMFTFYSAPYQIIYAAVGAGPVARGRLTGSDLARGIANTQKACAKEVYIGRGDLLSGLADAAKGPIALRNLNNAYPLNWSQNPAGAPIVDSVRLHCFAQDANSRGLVYKFVGQQWDRWTDLLTGTFVPCK